MEIGCLNNKYQLEKMLGQGGMGRVYQATDIEHNRSVAVKQIILGCDAPSSLIQRFQREYYFLSLIDHPNVIKAYDFFEVPGKYYHAFLVLEYVSGVSLDDFIIATDMDSLRLSEQLAIAIQIARAVEIINTLGVLHRDIKPGNVMLQLDMGRIKFLDLGLAKSLEKDLEKLTKTGSQIGTPAYMSPEQTNGETCPNSDVFSVGVVLYQFFAGMAQSPFKVGSLIQTMNHICNIDLPPLVETIERSMDPIEKKTYKRLSSVIAQSLHKDPKKRTKSAKMLGTKLNELYKSLEKSKSQVWRPGKTLGTSQVQKLEQIRQEQDQDRKIFFLDYIDVFQKEKENEEIQDFGTYKIIKKLGEGAAGKVYKVFDTKLEREIALKVLIKKDTEEKTIQSFLAEVRATAKLNHPNIVRIYNVGHEGERYFYAMDCIEGKPLKETIAEKKDLDIMKAIKLIKKISLAVDYAHRKGIIHRDLKSENIMIDTAEEPRVTDFGLAKIENAKNLNSEEAVIGTPLYMSPEQAKGEETDAQTDIYSLGVIFYELLTKRLPFEANNIFELLKKIAEAPATPPNKINPRISIPLSNACLKAMAKNKNQRYPSAAAFANALTKFELGQSTNVKVSTRKRQKGKDQKSKEKSYIPIVAIVVILIVFAVLYKKVEKDRWVKALQGAQKTYQKREYKKAFFLYQTLLKEKPEDKDLWEKMVQNMDQWATFRAYDRKEISQKIKKLRNDFFIPDLFAKKLIKISKMKMRPKNYFSKSRSISISKSRSVYSSKSQSISKSLKNSRSMHSKRLSSPKNQSSQKKASSKTKKVLLKNHLSIAKKYFEKGKVQQALSQCQLIFKNETEQNVLEKTIELLAKFNQKEQALEEAREYLKKFPQSAPLHLVAASIYLHNSQISQAKKHVTLAKKYSQKLKYTARSYAILGKICVKNKQMKKAFAHFNKAMTLTSKDVVAHYAVFAIWEERKKYKKALSVLRRALKNEESKASTYFNMARISIKIKHFSKAIEYLKNSLSYRDHWASKYALGKTYEKVGEVKKAKKTYYEILAKYPLYSAFSANNLARILIKESNYKEAEQLAYKAFTLYQDHTTTETYAWALYKVGKLKKAKDFVESIIKKYSKNTKICYYYGVILMDLKKKKAKIWLQKSIILGPDSFYAKDAHKRLQQLKKNS